MAGLKAGAPTPQALTVHEQSRVLEVGFSDGATFRIPFELMRVYSPSAEVQGHGPGQEVLQTGKRNVGMYRLQKYDSRTTGMHWHIHKNGAENFRAHQELGKDRIEVAVAIGADPVLTYCATAPLPTASCCIPPATSRRLNF